MLGIFADAIDEVRKLPPAGKVLVIGALGVGLFIIVAHARSSSGASGATTDAGTTAAGSTDNGTFSVGIPGVNPGTTTTTSGSPSSGSTSGGTSVWQKLTGSLTLQQYADVYGVKVSDLYYNPNNAAIESYEQQHGGIKNAAKTVIPASVQGGQIYLTHNALGVTMSN